MLCSSHVAYENGTKVDIRWVLFATLLCVVDLIIHQLPLFKWFESFQIYLIANGFYEKFVSTFVLTCIQEVEVFKAWTTPNAACALASPPFLTYSIRHCCWIHHCCFRTRKKVDGHKVKPVLLDPQRMIVKGIGPSTFHLQDGTEWSACWFVCVLKVPLQVLTLVLPLKTPW